MIHKRDYNNKEMHIVEKSSHIEEWKKQIIAFTTAEAPGGGESHTKPLVVTLTIGPHSEKEKNNN